MISSDHFANRQPSSSPFPPFDAYSLTGGSQQQTTLSAFQMTLYSVTLKEAEPSKTVTDDGKELSVMDLDQDLL